ncbi:MAG: PAS domain S-box protein [Anaerolineae bacterium]|nr:PAS domain S-box protein [Anaerolineae bacterium]
MNDNGEERGTHHTIQAMSDRFYRRLFQFNTNGCLITDTEGVIQQINPAAMTLLNESEDSLTGQSLVRFIAGDDRPTLLTYLTQLRDNGTAPIQSWEVRMQPAEHPAFTALLTGTAVEDGDGRLAGLLWELQDITARKQLEQDRHECRRRIQALFDHAQDSILLADDEARYVDVNPAACALLGYSREEFLTLDLWRLTPAVNRDAGQQQWQAFLAAGRLTGEYRLQRKDGTTIVVDYRAMAHIVPGLHLSVLRDITDRKQAEQEMLHQRDRARALADISDIFAKSGLDTPDVWQQIVRRTAELIGDTCVLTLLSDDEQWLIPCAFYNPDPMVLDYITGLLTSQPSRVDAALPGRVVRTGRPLLIPEVAVETMATSVEAKNRPFVEKVGIHSLLIVPLRVPDRIIGTLGLSRDRPGAPYTADHQLFLQQIADRAALFVENARLFGEVKQQTDHLRALARRLAETQEIERQALARELHDQVGQNLTGLDLNLNIIQAQLAAVSAPTRDLIQGRLADSMALVEDMAERVRDLMSELSPSVLDDFGLIAALTWYGQRFASRVDFAITVSGQEPTPRLAAPMEYALFRITQEALTNVAKHAQASAVTLTIDTNNGFVRLVIADDGRGFKPVGRSQAPNRRGWGLPTMAERAEAVGGRYRIESEPGHGTRVVVEVPQLVE